MSATFLTTLSIVLIEIIVILLIFLTVLFLRFRKLKASLKKTKPPVNSTTEAPEKTVSFLVHLKDEINRLTDRLEEESGQNETPAPAFSARLEHLNKELTILNNLKNAQDDSAYWQIIQQTYTVEAPPEQVEVSNEQGGREAFYLARIKNLESFKEMFFNTQAKLKESFDTIDALKLKISEMPSSEENAQLEEMIDKLSIDNISLNKQLTGANNELNNILSDSADNTNTAEASDTEDADQIADLREENDFLASQIQYLLEQELEKTRQMEEKIATNEHALQEKITECELLKASIDDDNAQDANETDTSSDYKSLQEENEFLSNQIQYLLSQELEATNKMQEQISAMEANLKAKEAEIEAAKDNPSPSNLDNNDLPAKLASIEEENEFLAAQIQHLLTQELEATNKMQQQINSMETDLRFKEAEIDALKNKRPASTDSGDGKSLEAKLASIEEENEFLTSQIQHLLQQELEATKKMQDKMASMDEQLSNKQMECDNLKNAAATANSTGENELSEKLRSSEDEKDFLASQIQQLLKQELAYSENMQQKMEQLKTSLLDKEAEYEILKTKSHQTENSEEIKQLTSKLHSIEEENEFLVSQIQHLLAQEVEHSQDMQNKIQTLEKEPGNKK